MVSLARTPIQRAPSSPLGQHAWPGRVSEQPPSQRHYALTEDLEETTVGSPNFDQSSSPLI
jgi:hypothetical protein